MTALFCDLVGSTELGERLDAEELRLILSGYFDEMTKVIVSWGGSVAKYVGDAVLALFGVPRSLGDDADRALHAALEMAERLELLNREIEADHGVRLEARTGINTGDVMNSAARLEQAADPGAILVATRTAANLSSRFELGAVVHVEAEGKADPITARRLLARPTAKARQASHDLVGRERQLIVLETHFDQVVDSRSPFMVTVAGDAGIGKSSLVGAFADRCVAGGATVLAAGCLPYGEGISAWPLREMLHRAAGIHLEDDSAAAGDKFRSYVERLADDQRMLYALAAGAGFHVPGNPLIGAPAETARRELADAWPSFLTTLARTAPVVVVVEDIHWAPPDLVKLLDRIVLRSTGPLLVVCTARPEFDESAGFGAHTPRTRIGLGPLGPEPQRALVGRLLPGMARTDVAEVVEVAGGNPFFIEEVVRHLVETGAIRDEGGRFSRVHDAPPVTVPDTVRSLLAARLDSLDPDVKNVLLAASVVGTEFWRDAVDGMVEIDDLDGALDVLEVEGHIVPGSGDLLPGQRQLDFRHDLVREVAYASLSRGRAARHHASFAGWIELRVGDRRDEFIDLIAHHRGIAAEERLLGWPHDREAGEQMRRSAFDDLLAAAGAGPGRMAWEETSGMVDRAEGLATTNTERMCVRLIRARTRRAFDRYADAWRDYVELIDLAESEGLEELRTDAVTESATMVGQMGGAIPEGLAWKEWLADIAERRLDEARASDRLEVPARS